MFRSKLERAIKLVSTSMRFCFSAIVLVIVQGLVSNTAGVSASGTTSTRKFRELLLSRHPEWLDIGSGPLCGVYSACISLQLMGIERSPADYVTSRYVGARQGSTPGELAAIIESAGAKADVLVGLSALDLRSLGHPLIANVRSTVTSEQYDHWVVVTFKEGWVRIYDGPRRPTRMSVAEFLGLWSGLGIVVSEPGTWALSSIWLGRLLLLQIGVLFSLALKGVLIRKPALYGGQFKREAIMISVGTCVLAMTGNVLLGDWLHHSRGVETAIAPFVSGSYKHGTLKEAHAASRNQHCLLIDARFEEDYEAGSIQEAVNIPVYASVWQVQEFLEDVDRHTPVVVFCQSRFCDFDDRVARNLAFLGFRDITVSDKGWAEYKEEYLAH